MMPDGRTGPADKAPIREHINHGLEAIFGSDPGVELHRADQADRLSRLVILLAQWAPRMNLTGHRDPMEIASRLVLDAAALVAALPELESASEVADLGSGAGFPGLPIAILRPHLRVFLVESRQKRHHFQREARRHLGLERVTPILGRSDEVEVHPCDIVVAQAMAQPEAALASMRTWARPGAVLVLPAAEDAARPDLGAGTADSLERRSYRVAITGVSRQLWIARVPSV
jgi:16S rRNA (guanine527-N7)-methyltransferase